MAGVRWDGDERGQGVADATAFAGGAAELAETMRRPGWVAEEPEIHLLPHIERACASLPLELTGAGTSADGTFELRLTCTRARASVGEIRAAVFALVGSFAEIATYVRQRHGAAADAPDGAVVFEVATGFLPSDTAFVPHGHTVRVTVVPANG